MVRALDTNQNLATKAEPLEVIPEQCFTDLLETLLKYIPDSLPAVGMVQNAIRWRKNGNKLTKNQELYTMSGGFKTGTCIGIQEAITVPKRPVQAIAFYIQDGKDQILTDAFLTTLFFNNWSFDKRECWFFEVSERLLPIVETFAVKKNLTPNLSKTVHFWMEKTQAVDLEVTCPPGVKLGPLTVEQVEYLDSYWPYRGEGTQEYTRILLTQNFGIGVYIEDSEMPVAWVLLNQNSCMTQLFTLEAHRQKGYARLVCNAMAKRLAEMDIYPRATVAVENVASKSLFTKMGYKTSGIVYYVDFK